MWGLMFMPPCDAEPAFLFGTCALSVVKNRIAFFLRTAGAIQRNRRAHKKGWRGRGIHVFSCLTHAGQTYGTAALMQRRPSCRPVKKSRTAFSCDPILPQLRFCHFEPPLPPDELFHVQSPCFPCRTHGRFLRCCRKPPICGPGFQRLRWSQPCLRVEV